MERLLGLAINDTTLISKVVVEHRQIFELGRGMAHGGWGLGVHRHGEMLVQKRRVTGGIDSASEVMKAGSRHSVLHVAGPRPGLFELERVQPYRYRNWLFASVGAIELPDAFVAVASERLSGFTAQGRWMSCPVECAMLLFMQAFHRVGELDRTRAHTRVLRDAIRRGCDELVEVIRQYTEPKLALVLHVRDFAYVLSLGRPVGLRELSLGDKVLPFRRRTESHVRAVAYTNDPGEGWGASLPSWSMAEIGPQADPTVIALT